MSGSLWLLQLQPASWRGYGFAVDSSAVRRGRRTAVHEYPFRDTVMVEDLGRGTRGVSFSGFVVGDTCYQQAQALLAQSEKSGPGTLVHPSLGTLQVALIGPMESRERRDLGRVVEISFEFIEVASTALTQSLGLLGQIRATVAAVAADVAVVSDYVATVRQAIDQGVQVVHAVVGMVEGWAATVRNLGLDASLIVHSVTGLAGNFGRYATGTRTASQPAGTTPAQALLAVTAGRASLASACARCSGLAAKLSAGTDNGFGGAAQATTEALRQACAEPTDAVRLLSVLAAYPTGSTPPSVAPIAAAVITALAASGHLLRAAALTSLARACADCQPASYDEAQALQSSVAAAFDAEILRAADDGLDATFSALRALRAAVISDLIERGADLPHLTSVRSAAPTPALTLAYRLYRDASRCDDLAARAAAPHPAFMPVAFTALSA